MGYHQTAIWLLMLFCFFCFFANLTFQDCYDKMKRVQSKTETSSRQRRDGVAACKVASDCLWAIEQGGTLVALPCHGFGVWGLVKHAFIDYAILYYFGRDQCRPRLVMQVSCMQSVKY